MNYIIKYAAMGAFLALIISYLDTKLLDNPKERSTYLKNMLMAAVVVAVVTAFIGEDNIGPVMSGGGSRGRGLSYISAIGEEIISGPPNF